jgi:hypothetical protein
MRWRIDSEWSGLGFFTAEIEIPERVEVFGAVGRETEFAYPVRVVAKHLARRERLIGERWRFELDGRGYYGQATLTGVRTPTENYRGSGFAVGGLSPIVRDAVRVPTRIPPWRTWLPGPKVARSLR